MTIGYILDDSLDRSDGVQQAVLTLGEYMRGLGHDVHYIVTETKRTDIENVHSVGSSFALQFNGNSVRTPLPASKRAIKALFSEVTFDVLHVQMPYSPLLAARVLKYAPSSVRKIGTFHILPYNVFASMGTKLLGLAQWRSHHSLDVCYAVSPPALEFMERAFHVRGSVLPNPIDCTFFHSFTNSKRINEKKQIVYVGRFEERKGVLQLINAYAALDAEVRADTQLTLVSKGPLLDQAKQLAASHSLDIAFPGFVSADEKARLLAGADIAVFPSLSGESFGIVLVEAMAAGAGITLGGDNPGYRSVLASWPETLFDPSDTVAFTRRLHTAIAQPNSDAALGEAQRTAAKQYDVQVIAKRLLVEAYK